MGFMDVIKNSIAEKQEELRLEKERQEKLQLKELECSKDRTIYLQSTFGYDEMGLPSVVCMRQKLDQTVYFGIDDNNIYYLVGYEWDGPMYEHVVNAETNVNTNTTQVSASTEVKKGKSGKMAAGAIIGTILMPGVGTAVGAAIGAGGKGKKNTTGTNNSNAQSNSNMQQVSKDVEKETTAIIRLRRISDNTSHSLTVICNSAIDAKLRCFDIREEKSASNAHVNTNNGLKEIKALKELLDMGAITQDEFEAKKIQILNI